MKKTRKELVALLKAIDSLGNISFEDLLNTDVKTLVACSKILRDVISELEK